MGFLSSIAKGLKKGAKAVAPILKAVAPVIATAALPAAASSVTGVLGVSGAGGGILTTVAGQSGVLSGSAGLQGILSGVLQQVGSSCVGCGGSTAPAPSKAIAPAAVPMAAPPILSAGTLGVIGLALWLIFGRSK